ncbi:UDP-N-acetylglucosamine 2-epimerase [Actinocrispum wychmicini]|uniref:UDP-N-acetylglucosamine 2-epimerase (Non-hydrolysing) n=1 Tax=Actinocrispum wychmicini TaxID=1213861 RepID=A0A4R2J9C6_9PSEU|nr:UDP-N-acetylglucosamine 2-epimerase [Actinocrispum wychmicini]TCO55913.1 UDP-N-acetylglucosamine 2-epimerase (non-hydrolysing) [Actinocrispum wychmicini]
MTRTFLTPGSVVFVLGSRAGMIRMTPVIRAVGVQQAFVYTGHDRMVTAELTELFTRCRPSLVVVQGDSEAALEGALAANAAGAPVLRVDAGLRSRDMHTSEEHNRVLIDHLSDYLCAATSGNVDNLLAESIDRARVVRTGALAVEAVTNALPEENERLRYLSRHGVRPDGYVLATIHHQNTTDTLEFVLAELMAVARAGWPVLLPLCPHVSDVIDQVGRPSALYPLTVVPPVDYQEFLSLARHAALVVSDSGGVQEEVTVLKRPLIVLRRSTERPEVLADFATLVGPYEGVAKRALAMLDDIAFVHKRLSSVPCPFGDALSSLKIAQVVQVVAGESWIW